MKRLWFASLLLALVAVPAFGGQLLSNQGFETGSLSPWYNARNFCFGTCIPYSVTNTTSNSGTYSVTVTGNLELRQDFTPTPGSSITNVSFWAIAFFGDGAIDFFYTDGSDQEFVYFASNSAWTFVNATADVDTTKILSGFSVWGGSPNGVYYYDDLSVNSAVPEPGSLALFGSGVVGLAGLVRRKIKI